MPISGVWAPLLTPVNANYEPDRDRLVRHAHRVLEDGCHGVVAFGTTGEAPSFAVNHRISAVNSIVDSGVEASRVVVGTGSASLTDAVAVTRAAMARGCAGVLVIPPFYFKDPSIDGVFRFFDELIARTGCDAVYLYHFPRLSQVPITHELVGRLMDVHGEAIAGIKDSTGDLESTAGFIEAFPDLAVMPGTETLFLDAMRKGGAGVITAGANINATAIREVWDSFQAGDDERADRAQAKVTAYRRWMQQNPTVPALRKLLSEVDDGFARSVPPWPEALPELGSPPA